MNADEREQCIRALLPIVRATARRVHRMLPMADFDDLIGDGCVGLIRAVDGYDARRGAPLESYARRVVLGAMLNGVRRMDTVPERTRRTMRDAVASQYAEAQQTGEIPAFVELERRAPRVGAARVEVYRRTHLSLDTTLPLGERLELDRSNDPQSVVVAAAERDRIHAAVAALPPRRRRIVVEHYFGEKRLRELVVPLGISRQRVSQLHLSALEQLRATLTATA